MAALQTLPGFLSDSAQTPLLGLPVDGGASFLHQVQFKANGLSFIWAIATLVFAAAGAGPISLDRLIGKEF